MNWPASEILPDFGRRQSGPNSGSVSLLFPVRQPGFSKKQPPGFRKPVMEAYFAVLWLFQAPLTGRYGHVRKAKVGVGQGLGSGWQWAICREGGLTLRRRVGSPRDYITMFNTNPGLIS